MSYLVEIRENDEYISIEIEGPQTFSVSTGHGWIHSDHKGIAHVLSEIDRWVTNEEKRHKKYVSELRRAKILLQKPNFIESVIKLLLIKSPQPTGEKGEK